MNRVNGVINIKKTAQSTNAFRTAWDVDDFWCEGPSGGGICDDLPNIQEIGGVEDSNDINYSVDTTTVGTKVVTGILAIASGYQCDCGVISYPDPVIGVALGYVHVYEINLQTGGTSLPVKIS